MPSQEPCFGISGCPPSYEDSEYSADNAQAPLWVKSLGLDLYEAPWTFSLPKPDTVKRLGEAIAKSGVKASVHSSYYVVLGSPDPVKITGSLEILAHSCASAKECGAERVVFHPGSAYEEREKTLERLINVMARFVNGSVPDGITLCPETGGKKGAIGSLEEIIAICKAVPKCRPCIDFAHLRATSGGGWEKPADFIATFDAIKAALGEDVLRETHFHISPIKFGPKGEQEHWPYTKPASAIKRGHYPLPEHLAEALFLAKLPAWVVSECGDSQDKGALAMKKRYTELKNKLRIREFRNFGN